MACCRRSEETHAMPRTVRPIQRQRGTAQVPSSLPTSFTPETYLRSSPVNKEFHWHGCLRDGLSFNLQLPWGKACSSAFYSKYRSSRGTPCMQYGLRARRGRTRHGILRPFSGKAHRLDADEPAQAHVAASARPEVPACELPRNHALRWNGGRICG